MTKQALKTEKSKARILKAATKLFGKHGYDGFSITVLCQTYKISKGLLYHNFTGKADLFVHCVEKCYDALLAYLQGEAHVPSLEQYVTLRIAFFEKNPLLARIFFESFFQRDEPEFERIPNIRQALIDYNRLVFAKFLDTVSLRPGVGKEEAMQYFEMMQEMFNSYYSSLAVRTDALEALATTHERSLSNFLNHMIWGVADQTAGS